MYHQVHFHRMTSNRKKHSIFRPKKDGMNLDTIAYANNLKSYLTKIKHLKSISIAELNTVLMSLQAAAAAAAADDTSEIQKYSDIVTIPTDDFQVGEHIASFWLDDDNYKWYLGVSEHCAENSPDDYHISYFDKASKDGTNWNYPEVEKKNH